MQRCACVHTCDAGGRYRHANWSLEKWESKIACLYVVTTIIRFLVACLRFKYLCLIYRRVIKFIISEFLPSFFSPFRFTVPVGRSGRFIVSHDAAIYIYVTWFARESTGGSRYRSECVENAIDSLGRPDDLFSPWRRSDWRDRGFPPSPFDRYFHLVTLHMLLRCKCNYAKRMKDHKFSLRVIL